MKTLAIILALSASPALAQPSGGGPGPGPTPNPWVISGNSVSFSGCVLVPSTTSGGCRGNGTISANQFFAAPSTTAGAGLNIIPGVAPSAPINGAMWTTSAGLFVRINGGTVGPLIGPLSFSATSPLAVTFPGGVVNLALNYGTGLTVNAGNLILDFTTATGTLRATNFPALTGDVTTSAGALAATLATVNANVGSWGSATASPTLTVNGKGLITAASNTPIAIAASQITSGNLACARMPAMTGNVTSTIGTCALTIGAVQVTNAMLVNSSVTIAGHVVALGGTQAINFTDLTGSIAAAQIPNATITNAMLNSLTAWNTGSGGTIYYNGGNVGIGTSTPTVASGSGLAVYGGVGQARIKLTNSTTGDASTDGFQILAGGLDAYFENREAGSLYFLTNNIGRLTIDLNGNTILAASAFLNFGITGGTGGYGFSDISGVISTKNSSGSWNPVASTTGTLTNGHCVSINASGLLVDAGGACTTGGGGGTVSSATLGQIGLYAASGTTISGSAVIGQYSSQIAIGASFTSPTALIDVNGTGRVRANLQAGVLRGEADLREFASLSCNPASLSSTNVAAAIYAANTAGYLNFFMPDGCFWDMSTVPGGSGWSAYTIPDNFAIRGERKETSGISTNKASFTGVIAGTTLTVSGVTGASLQSGMAVFGSGVSNNPTQTVITGGSGTTWTVNVSQTVGPISMQAKAQITFGAHVTLDNVFYDSAACYGINNGTIGNPAMCPLGHFDNNGPGGSLLTGYPYEDHVFACGPYTTVPAFNGNAAITGTGFFDNPCIGLNQQGYGDGIFINDIGNGQILNLYDATGPIFQVQAGAGAGGRLLLGNSSSAHGSGSIVITDNLPSTCTIFSNVSTLSWVCSSDERLKHDIVDTPSRLDWLKSFRVRDFAMNGTNVRRTGVIAQELQRTHPDMVRAGPVSDDERRKPIYLRKAQGDFLAAETPSSWDIVKAMQDTLTVAESASAKADGLLARMQEMQAEIEQLKTKVR